MTRSERIFGQALSAANRVRASTGKPALLKELAAEIEVSQATLSWAIGETRKRSPETAELLYRALGRRMSPPAGVASGGAAKTSQAPAEGETAEDIATDDDAAATADEDEAGSDESDDETEVLVQVVRWLGKVDPAMRERIMAAARAFYPIVEG